MPRELPSTISSVAPDGTGSTFVSNARSAPCDAVWDGAGEHPVRAAVLPPTPIANQTIVRTASPLLNHRDLDHGTGTLLIVFGAVRSVRQGIDVGHGSVGA